jgi:hypothetical protein
MRHAFCATSPLVIPGQPGGLSSESVSPRSAWMNGFRARRRACHRAARLCGPVGGAPE